LNILFAKCRLNQGERYQPLMISPPLGILYLIGTLKRARTGRDDFRIFDLSLADQTPDAALASLWIFLPEVVAISAYSREAPAAQQFALLCKSRFPKSTIIIGGPYVTAEKASVLNEPAFDFAIKGEGEKAFLEFINALENQTGYDTINNLIFRDGERIVENESRPFEQNLDDLAPPAWEEIDLQNYQGTNHLTGRQSHALLLTSRGCPLQCTYCTHLMGFTYRTHSPERVITEISNLYYLHNIKYFEIIDDNFNLDRNRTRTILELIIQEKLKIHLLFPNGLRLDLLNSELIDLMKSAGTIQIAAPFDSGSPAVQERYGRRLNLEKAEEITCRIIEKQIFTIGYFIVGYPDETLEEYKQTVQMIRRIPFHFVRFFRAVVFPGTPLAASQAQLPNALDQPQCYDYFGQGYRNAAISPTRISRDEWCTIVRTFQPQRLRSFLRAHPLGWRVISQALAMAYNRLVRAHYRRQLPKHHGNVTNTNRLRKVSMNDDRQTQRLNQPPSNEDSGT